VLGISPKTQVQAVDSKHLQQLQHRRCGVLGAVMLVETLLVNGSILAVVAGPLPIIEFSSNFTKTIIDYEKIQV